MHKADFLWWMGELNRAGDVDNAVRVRVGAEVCHRLDAIIDRLDTLTPVLQVLLERVASGGKG